MELVGGDIVLTDKAKDRLRQGGQESFYVITRVEWVKGKPDQGLIDYLSNMAVGLNQHHANCVIMAMGNKRRQGVTPDDKENVARAMSVFLANARASLKAGEICDQAV